MPTFKQAVSLRRWTSRGKTHRLGGPLRLRTDLPVIGQRRWPDCWVPEQMRMATEGALGIVSQGQDAGRNYWLIVSVLPTVSPFVKHHAALEADDKGVDDVIWFGNAKVTISRVDKTFLSVRAELNTTSMQGLWDVVGEPRGDGRWLAGLLLPRRLPGATTADHRCLRVWAGL